MIGNTPLVKLKHLSEPNCAEIYVKLEGGNPTGSMKDRMALSMVEGAERRGELKKGWKVVEYTGEAPAVPWLWYVLQRGTRLILYRLMFLLTRNFRQ